jgi:alanine racemase
LSARLRPALSARLRIDLSALGANYATFQRHAAPGVAGAVVKADAYGLGLSPVSRALWQGGCRDFFVASAEEGMGLRAELPDAAIYVFEGALPGTMADLCAGGLIPVLNHTAQADLWRTSGGGRPAAVHVDTGMHRLGFDHDVRASAFRGIRVCLLVTHLACADEPEHPLTVLQLQRLSRVRDELPGVPVSIGNSAAVLQGPQFAGDLCRPGVGLYGGNPYLRESSPVRPVVTLEAPILQIRQVVPGDSVGYGATFSATAAMELAIVGAGYGDGVPRLLSNRGEVAWRGQRCAIVGRVSMDLTTVDVTGCGAQVGDWVEIFGTTVLVDEVAAWAQTIPYEILTGLGQRPRRVYQ